MAERTGHDFVGTAVITLSDGVRVGRVADVTFDTTTGRITGFLVTVSGLFAKPRILSMSQVQNLGGDAVTILSEGTLQEQSALSSEPTGLSAASLEGRPVLTASGNVIGKVADFLVDAQALTVSLSLRTGLLDNALHGRPRLPIPTIHAIGKDTIIVPDTYDPNAAQSH